MFYRDNSTGGYPVTQKQIKQTHKNVSFPRGWGDDTAASLGYDYVAPTPKPEPTATTRVTEGPPEHDGTRWLQTWTFVDLTAEELAAAEAAKLASVQVAAQAKADAIQAEKVRARDSGFLVDGVLFDSDQSARISYAELALRLSAEPTFTTPWKASAGAWVTMDAVKYQEVAATGGAHIQAVFAWQAARDQELAVILAGTGTPDEKLAAIAAVSATFE